jgi:hypothetical protein
MYAPLARSDYYRTSVLPDSHQLATSLPAAVLARQRKGDRGQFPRSHDIDQPGRRPALPRQPRHTYATPTPQTFSVASPPTDSLGFGVDHPTRRWSCVAPRPLSTRFEPALFLRGFHHWFTFVPPSDLACRTRPVWQYQTVPALSGLLPPSPAFPGSGCPPLHRAAATTRREGLSPPSTPCASWRTNP